MNTQSESELSGGFSSNTTEYGSVGEFGTGELSSNEYASQATADDNVFYLRLDLLTLLVPLVIAVGSKL